jgi:nitrous oxidase accessory protein
MGKRKNVEFNTILECEPPKKQKIHKILFVGANHNYKTINDALKASQNGDTIKIYSGEYNESLNITNSVTIESVSDENVVVTEKNGNVVEIKDLETKNVTIKNITISQEGDKSSAIYIHGQNSNILIEGCNIKSKGVSGILVLKNSSPILKNCKIHSCKTGLWIKNSKVFHIYIK